METDPVLHCLWKIRSAFSLTSSTSGNCLASCMRKDLRARSFMKISFEIGKHWKELRYALIGEYHGPSIYAREYRVARREPVCCHMDALAGKTKAQNRRHGGCRLGGKGRNAGQCSCCCVCLRQLGEEFTVWRAGDGQLGNAGWLLLHCTALCINFVFNVFFEPCEYISHLRF